VAISHAIMTPTQAATITVNSHLDDGTDCTLREAIVSINSASLQNGCIATGTFGTNDTIDFDLATPTITLSEGQLEIAPTTNVTINGGASGITIDANQKSRVLYANSATLTLDSIKVTGGNADIGGGIAATKSFISIMNSTISANFAYYTGGGIHINRDSSLSIKNSTVTNNSTSIIGGGGIYSKDSLVKIKKSEINHNYSPFGGGVYVRSYSSLYIEDSLISSNSASLFGGIYSLVSSSINISNSTISDNNAVGGGGIGIGSNSSANIESSTITDNSAVTAAGGGTGGLYASRMKTLSISNTIISGNSSNATSGREILFSNIDSVHLKNNVLGDAGSTYYQAFSNSGVSISASNNIIATSDQSNLGLNQILKPLADNGGPTQTHALATNSPAIDAGDVSTCLATDQRGELRDNLCDIGAYEKTATQDPLGFTYSVTPATEGDDQFIILTVELNEASQTARRIRFETADDSALAGVDYEARAGNIYFEPGATRKRLWFRVLDDADKEGDETFMIQLTPLFGSNNPTNVPAIITDDDASKAPFSVEVTNTVEGNERQIIARLKLNEPFTSNYNIDFFTVDGTATDGLDYVGRSGTIYIKPGQTVKRRWFEVLTDQLVEGDENFTIRFVPRQDPSIVIDVEATIMDAN